LIKACSVVRFVAPTPAHLLTSAARKRERCGSLALSFRAISSTGSRFQSSGTTSTTRTLSVLGAPILMSFMSPPPCRRPR
jgi:hypothetical protein